MFVICGVPLVRWSFQVIIRTSISKRKSWPEWHIPVYFIYAPHTMLVIYIWTVLVFHDLIRKLGGILWYSCTLRIRLWLVIFVIIFYQVRSNIPLIYIWRIIFHLSNYYSQKGVKQTIYGGTCLFLFSCLLDFIWWSMCSQSLLLCLI